MAQFSTSVRSQRGGPRPSLTLIALFVPGILFGIGLVLVRGHPRYSWVSSVDRYPWEFWTILGCGMSATVAGVLDWRYHRARPMFISRLEHQYELAALAGGGTPLFVLMAAASLVTRPQILLIPIVVVVLGTAVLIAYDEFVFHRKRCGVYETVLHRVLVFGNGLAWLAWMHWCFVRGETHG